MWVIEWMIPNGHWFLRVYDDMDDVISLIRTLRHSGMNPAAWSLDSGAKVEVA